jgi:hypothetical protein
MNSVLPPTGGGYPGPLKPDMEVCDVNGEKVGTVAHVYEPPFPADEPDEAREAVVEVKTGLLGLGAHYWIPRSLFQEALRDSAFLTKAKAELKGLGLDARPPYLEAAV